MPTAPTSLQKTQIAPSDALWLAEVILSGCIEIGLDPDDSTVIRIEYDRYRNAEDARATLARMVEVRA